jgi:AraC family transcriptional activator of pobA
MSYKAPQRIPTIAAYHRLMGLPKPLHPLVSLVELVTLTPPVAEGSFQLVFDFYSISLKRGHNATFRYGQTTADFEEGTLFFMAPGQVFGLELAAELAHRPTGWVLLVHPDLLWGTPLAQTMRHYEFFGYSLQEALHLSEREERLLTSIAHALEQEYQTAIDRATQNILVTYVGLLLQYAERFYQRQFFTRKILHHELLSRFEQVVDAYFTNGALASHGLPSVNHMAEALHISPTYLSSLLRVLIGQTTQQYLHDKLIALAKEKLATTTASVGEIAYELGFEHLPSFSKLFKLKTKLSPLKFRHSCN